MTPPHPCRLPPLADPRLRRSKLYYFYGRGLGESLRFALGAAGAEWEDVFVRERADMVALLDASELMFEQLPLLVMADGTKVVQSGAIVRYIGRAWGMYGDGPAEAALIDQLLGGIGDFGGSLARWSADCVPASHS